MSKQLERLVRAAYRLQEKGPVVSSAIFLLDGPSFDELLEEVRTMRHLMPAVGKRLDTDDILQVAMPFGWCLVMREPAP